MFPGNHDDIMELAWEQHDNITKSKLSRRAVSKTMQRRHYSDVTGMMSSLDNTSQSPWQHRGPTKLYPWQPPNNTIQWQHPNNMEDIFTDYHRSNGHSSQLKVDCYRLESDCIGSNTDSSGLNSNHVGVNSIYTGLDSDHVGLHSDHAGFKVDQSRLELSKRWCYLYWSDLEGMK